MYLIDCLKEYNLCIHGLQEGGLAMPLTSMRRLRSIRATLFILCVVTSGAASSGPSITSLGARANFDPTDNPFLFDLGIWRLDGLMRTVAADYQNGAVKTIGVEEVVGWADYDLQRKEIVLGVNAQLSTRKAASYSTCKEAWHRTRKLLFWANGIPLSRNRVERDAKRMLLRHFSQFSVQPHISEEDLRPYLLKTTRLVVQFTTADDTQSQCSARLGGRQLHFAKFENSKH